MEAATKMELRIPKTRNNDRLLEIVLYTWAVLVLIVVMYPLFFIVIASFSDPSAVGSGQVWLYPKGFTLDGYKELFKHSNIWLGYRNTIVYTAVGTAIGLAVNLSAAYALSRKDLVGRRFLSLFFIFTMFFNGGLVPTFLTIRDFHLYDTFWVMVLPFSVAVFDIIVARTFFQTGIPPELWEAAQVDGCGNLRFYVQMVLPLSKAIISVLALWFAVGQWNSYFNALIYLHNPDLYPLQLVLREILVTNQMQNALGTGEAAQIALRLANLLRYSVIIVATLPIMCLYPFVQKHFNKGVMIGAVKS
ncbi:carbohydrate ABC transporter permease [Cohnella fermenti]|uniref:Carbohydrate ABC transporter permease n=1 Tax=Cohnella fermenti TaxID=2565925 RepID=A0A4S4BYN6_9BACL|nr:carbohydrate ABC transporter permease [Cohnella fermenti]THF80386.1 carbohydrate ABC transporter permease [Cohnella fermenti]